MKHTPAIVVAVSALVFGAGACAQVATQLLPEQSEIVFVSKQMGVPVEGVFKKFEASIDFDPKKPEGGSVTLAIDTASASLGIAQTDAELPKPEWFNSARFPRATFQSSALKARGGGRYEINGKLSIKGSVRDIVVPVSLTQSAGTSWASGSFVIKRLEFKIGEGDWADVGLVGNDVQVRFKLALSGLGPL